jgi:hypothetical protein
MYIAKRGLHPATAKGLTATRRPDVGVASNGTAPFAFFESR